jgi:uncharacterized protein (UPF0261 family)
VVASTELGHRPASLRVGGRIRGPTDHDCLPLKGVSAIDADGQPFDDPAARQTLFDGVRQSHGAAELLELEHHINDPEFAELAARRLIDAIQQG